MRQTRWLPAALWPVGIAAVVAGFVVLFRDEGDVALVAVINRSVGGSFLICGLIAWQRRPANRTGALMTATGFLFLAEPLLAAIGRPVGDSLAELVANWWTIPFAALVLSFPSGAWRRAWIARSSGPSSSAPGCCSSPGCPSSPSRLAGRTCS